MDAISQLIPLLISTYILCLYECGVCVLCVLCVCDDSDYAVSAKSQSVVVSFFFFLKSIYRSIAYNSAYAQPQLYLQPVACLLMFHYRFVSIPFRCSLLLLLLLLIQSKCQLFHATCTIKAEQPQPNAEKELIDQAPQDKRKSKNKRHPSAANNVNNNNT